jgi:hypothetical protein
MPHGDPQHVLPIAPWPGGQLPHPWMIPRDAQGTQAAQARSAEACDSHQQHGGGDGGAHHDLQNHPARRDAARDRPAPPASLPQRSPHLPMRCFSAFSHRVPSRSVLDVCARLIGFDPPVPHRGCGQCSRQSTNHGQLPDVWKFAGRAVPGPDRANAAIFWVTMGARSFLGCEPFRGMDGGDL